MDFPSSFQKAKVIQIGNGANIDILFIFPILIIIQSHMFEIYTMVSTIHDNVNLFLGVIHFVELEAEKTMRHFKFNL